MTPIKISRKNTRHQRRAVVAAKPARKRPLPSGRPAKRLAANLIKSFDGTSNKFEKSSRSRPLRNMKSKWKMATLEKIPTELLHKIFLLSMNLDLPRSSPILAGKLSGEQTFVHFIILGFQPSWEWDYRVRAENVIQERGQIIPGNPKLETAILSCRFATLPRLMKAQETWLRRAFSDPILNVPAIQPPKDVGLLVEKIEKDDHFVKYFDDFANNTDQIKENWRAFEDEFPDKWGGLLNIHPNTEIPDRLLQGPWTFDMMQKLFWLARAHAKIDWIESTSGEAALLGLHTAIKTGNLQALWILHWLGTSEHITFDILVWAIQNAGGDRDVLLLRLKTMYEGYNPEDHRLQKLQVMWHGIGGSHGSPKLTKKTKK